MLMGGGGEKSVYAKRRWEEEKDTPGKRGREEEKRERIRTGCN